MNVHSILKRQHLKENCAIRVIRIHRISFTFQELFSFKRNSNWSLLITAFWVATTFQVLNRWTFLTRMINHPFHTVFNRLETKKKSISNVFPSWQSVPFEWEFCLIWSALDGADFDASLSNPTNKSFYHLSWHAFESDHAARPTFLNLNLNLNSLRLQQTSSKRMLLHRRSICHKLE